MDTATAVGMIDVVRRHRADRWGQPDLGMEFSEPPPDA
jgi:hypothetical protein